MKKTIVLIILILLTCVGCTAKKTVQNRIGDDFIAIEKQRIKIVIKDEVKTILDNMSINEKIGQMIIIGIEGAKIDDKVKELIQQNHVGGIILFGRNIIDSKQLTNLIRDLNEINKPNKLPLFISVDEEGGRVTRLPQGTPKFPSSRSIGRKKSRELSYKTGQEIGDALSFFGFNMDFAPVMDIQSNPKNTVIGDRSFGSTPDIVSSLGIETMKGLQSKNIISVIKHFPGHGDTTIDSHFGLPMVNHDKKRLDSFELVPFKDAIKNGAEVIMTAHIKFPKIDDSGKPATLSSKILTGILREELGFNRVIITDDMEMDAIAKNFGVKESAVEAISAGADIILMCHSFEKQKMVLQSIKESVEKGQLSIERIDQSVERIIRLKQKYIKMNNPAQ